MLKSLKEKQRRLSVKVMKKVGKSNKVQKDYEIEEARLQFEEWVKNLDEVYQRCTQYNECMQGAFCLVITIFLCIHSNIPSFYECIRLDVDWDVQL